MIKSLEDAVMKLIGPMQSVGNSEIDTERLQNQRNAFIVGYTLIRELGFCAKQENEVEYTIIRNRENAQETLRALRLAIDRELGDTND